MSQKIPILTCKVAGVTFEGRQGTIRQLLKGADMKDILVRLEPEPDNPYDSGAIKVLAIPSHEQLGYIPKEVNEDLLQLWRWAWSMSDRSAQSDVPLKRMEDLSSGLR